jgi:hypothetical protein
MELRGENPEIRTTAGNLAVKPTPRLDLNQHGLEAVQAPGRAPLQIAFSLQTSSFHRDRKSRQPDFVPTRSRLHAG